MSSRLLALRHNHGLQLLSTPHPAFRNCAAAAGGLVIAADRNGANATCAAAPPPRRRFSGASGVAPGYADSLRAWYASCLDSGAVVGLADQLCALHEACGAPWWLAIAAGTVALRAGLMAPAHVTAQKTAMKRMVVFEQLDKVLVPEIRKRIRARQAARGWSDAECARRLNRVVAAVREDKIVEYNCSAAKLYLPFLLQIPAWVALSMAIRRIATGMHSEASFNSMAQEGMLWMPDLTVPDPTGLVLPASLGLLYLANTAAHANNHPVGQDRPAAVKAWTAFFAAVSVSMSYLSTMVPSAVALYWTASAASGLAVTLAVVSPKFRNATRIPLLPGESGRPYRRMWENAVAKTIKIKPRFTR